MHNKHFNIKPSKFLSHWLNAIHLLALILILMMPISFLNKLIFSILIASCYFYYKNRHLVIASAARQSRFCAQYGILPGLSRCARNDGVFILNSFQHHQNDQWFLYDKFGNKQSVTLLKDNFISQFLLILHFRKQPPLILFKKQLAEREWRYLQKLLRS